MNTSSEIGKKAAGEAAAELIQSGMLIGLGTGSTVAFFIRRLASRLQNGLKISAVASSLQSGKLAASLGIPLVDDKEVSHLDITVDGADEIDPKKQMIKGGGGALLREKIIASMSREMIVIVDQAKCVDSLGETFFLPVEIIPFGWHATVNHIHALGLKGKLRLNAGNTPFITDNGNYIYDIDKESFHQKNLTAINQSLLLIPGVVETGLFFNLAGRVIIGRPSGRVDLLN